MMNFCDECFFWGEQEAYIGQPRIAPPEWTLEERLSWLAGYDALYAVKAA